MKCRLLVCLSCLAVAAPLPAALSPIPEVTVNAVALPLVKIRIANPSKTEECRIWKSGNSWEEQNKWFSLRRAGNRKIVEIHPARQVYTVNIPRTIAIQPEKAVTFSYDLSDDSWELPKDFAPGDWNFEIQAHLQIRFGVEAHEYGVFSGHVTSDWYEPKRPRKVEAGAQSTQLGIHTALEARHEFIWKRLTERLDPWKGGTPPEDMSVAEYLGSDFPSEDLVCVADWATPTLIIALPNGGILRMAFHTGTEFPGSTATIDTMDGPKEALRLEFFPAREILQKTPVQKAAQATAGTGQRLTKPVTNPNALPLNPALQIPPFQTKSFS